MSHWVRAISNTIHWVRDDYLKHSRHEYDACVHEIEIQIWIIELKRVRMWFVEFVDNKWSTLVFNMMHRVRENQMTRWVRAISNIIDWDWGKTHRIGELRLITFVRYLISRILSLSHTRHLRHQMSHLRCLRCLIWDVSFVSDVSFEMSQMTCDTSFETSHMRHLTNVSDIWRMQMRHFHICHMRHLTNVSDIWQMSDVSYDVWENVSFVKCLHSTPLHHDICQMSHMTYEKMSHSSNVSDKCLCHYVCQMSHMTHFVSLLWLISPVHPSRTRDTNASNMRSHMHVSFIGLFMSLL